MWALLAPPLCLHRLLMPMCRTPVSAASRLNVLLGAALCLATAADGASGVVPVTVSDGRSGSAWASVSILVSAPK